MSRNGLKDGKIRQLKPGAKKSELYAPLTDGRLGNGIRFDKDGRMYVADFKGHNVLVFEKGQKKDNVYFTTNTLPPSATKFTQPNDLAIGNDGTIYASDPAFGSGTGRIWRITRAPSGKGNGEVMTSNRKDGKMGVTNGLDVSPDGKTLYVGESTTGWGEGKGALRRSRAESRHENKEVRRCFGGRCDSRRMMDTDGPQAARVWMLRHDVSDNDRLM